MAKGEVRDAPLALWIVGAMVPDPAHETLVGAGQPGAVTGVCQKPVAIHIEERRRRKQRVASFSLRENAATRFFPYRCQPSKV